jgi:hypothetical protein
VNIQNRTSVSKEAQSLDVILFASIGAGFWLVFVLLIRFWGEYLFIRNPWLLGLLVVSILLAWILVKIVTTICNLEGNRVLTATVMMSITATRMGRISSSIWKRPLLNE